MNAGDTLADRVRGAASLDELDGLCGEVIKVGGATGALGDRDGLSAVFAARRRELQAAAAAAEPSAAEVVW